MHAGHPRSQCMHACEEAGKVVLGKAPSRRQVRPVQPLRQELLNDNDLCDVLTEESEGLPQTRSLSPCKCNLPSDHHSGAQAWPRLPSETL